jgi:predicted nucleotidyltransferase
MSPDNLSSALFGKTRRAILALLFSHPDESYYLRQIVRLVRAGQGAVQRELQRLSGAEIVSRSVRGRISFYQANQACPIFPELRGLVVKTAGVVEVLRGAMVPLGTRVEAAFVFGSAAQGRLRAGSDVDLFVIGEAAFGEVIDAVSAAQVELAREVNPTVFDRLEFERRVASENHFIAAVLEQPKLFVIGSEHELARLARGGMAH